MKILLIANGISVHTRRWATGLRDRGHQVRVVAEAPCPEPDIRTIALPPLRRGRTNLLALALVVRQAAQQFKPDLVHAHYVSHYGLLAGLARLRGPLVMSVWGADVEVFPHSAVNRAVLRWTLSQATTVTATSQYLASVTAQFLRPGQAVTVVPFGVDPELYQPPEHRRPPSELLVSNKHVEPVYGGDVLIRALAKLPGAEAVLMGQGSFREDLLKLAYQLGVQHRVRFTGPLEPPAVRDLLQQGAVAVYPSRRESFGVATLEASATELAVVATRVGGLPEVVREGQTGVLVEPEHIDALADALSHLLAHPAQAREMGRAGRQWVMDRYTWERSLDAMEEVYTRVLVGA